jgi:hypothetical protein
VSAIKSISLWQPWASLWLSPNKRHETRHWATSHRGRLLVHATKKFVKDIDGPLRGILEEEFGGHWATELPVGAIIGMVDLIDVIPTEEIYADEIADLADDEQIDIACGDFAEGRFGWRRGTYWVFREPIAYRGRQSLFSVPHEIVAAQLATAKEVGGA